MKKNIVSLCLVVCLAGLVNAQAVLPKVWVMNAARIAQVKQQFQQGDTTAKLLVGRLLKVADPLLNMKPLSVMDKGSVPASGSKHDYMSQAPYFWYDSSKPGGLPYMRRDGVRNPEIDKITDHKYLADLDMAARTLSLAWHFTGEEKYAQKAASLLRHWFLNADTKMNPNLDFGQAIPGVNTGRGIGIIETNSLPGIADAAGLLTGSRSWTATDMDGMQQWYTQFLHWMLTSRNGRDEHAAKNNHGTWYYWQAVDYALFTGNILKARELAEESKKLIAGQIDAEGKMPLELERTNALWYTTYNLQAWFRLANLAEKAGTDLWQHTNPNKAGIRLSLDWLYPYAMGEKKFPYPQISSYKKTVLYELLLQAAGKYHYPAYFTIAKKTGEAGKNVLTELLFGNGAISE